MKYLNILLICILSIGFGFNTNLYSQISLVKDISDGAGGAFNANSIAGIAFEDKLIFPAWTEGSGLELWISDGTPAGTLLLKDINEGTGNSDPQAFFKAFGKVYFNAFNESSGKELWVTDGTSGGTQMVMDIESGTAGSDPIPGEIYNGYLYFAATANGDREVWRVDSLSSPQLFLNTNEVVQGKPREFKSANGLLYFSANVAPIEFGGIDQDEPIVTDGTEFNTYHLEIGTEGPAGGNISDFEPLGDYVFFLGSATGEGLANDVVLYYTEGDPFSTGIFSTDFETPAYWLMPVKGKINLCDEYSLYKLEASEFQLGTTSIGHYANSNRKAEKNPDAYLNENLCIPVQDLDNDLGVELYFSDGDNVWMSTDINPGSASSDPWYIVSNGTKALFAASSSDTNRELYESDGTPDGTKLVADLYPGEEGSDPIQLVVVGNNVFFYAKTPETGYELYKYELEPSSVTHPSTIAFDGKAYPQPAISGEPVIILWDERNHFERAELTQANGAILRQYEILDENQMTIETNHLSPGIYYLNLFGRGGISVCKIIAQ